MSYLLDTDHISILQRRSGAEHALLIGRMGLHAGGEFSFSIVSFHEQVLGAHTFLARARSPRDVIRGYRLLDEILRGFSAAPSLPFDDSASDVYDDLIARRRNVRDFEKVPGLSIENWTE